MTRRHFLRLRVVVALIAVALAFSVFSSSAATLGGLGPDALGGASGLTKHVTAVQLEWNRSENTTPAQLTTLRLTAGTGETFSTSDVVNITAAGAGAVTCSTQTTVSKDTATVDLSFPSCGVPLWELSSVAVNISGTRGATTLESNIGVLNAGLASFGGAVVRPDAPLSPGFTTARKGRAESLATVSLGVGDATVEQLVGRRAVVVLSNTEGQTTSYVADVGTRTSNQGIWAEIDPKTSVPTVTAELSKLVPGGASPTTADVAQFRMVLLQPQRLGAGQAPTNQYALTTGPWDHPRKRRGWRSGGRVVCRGARGAGPPADGHGPVQPAAGRHQPAAPMAMPNAMADQPGVTTVSHARAATCNDMEASTTQRMLSRSIMFPTSSVAMSPAMVWGMKLAAASALVKPLAPRRLIWWNATAVQSIPETARPLISTQK